LCPLSYLISRKIPVLRPRLVKIESLLLLMKYFIYTTKLSEMIPVFCVFRNYLHKRINLEKQIALTKNKLGIFYNMWSFIL